MPDSEIKNNHNIYFCLDSEQLKISKEGLSEAMTRINVDLYTCQPGSVKPCNPTFAPHDMLMMTWVYEKTVNINDYQHPITQGVRNLGFITPSMTLRYQTNYMVGWTELATDKGLLTAAWENEKILTIFDIEGKTNEKSLANIPRNYLSQGRVFYSDIEYHIEIESTNEKVEIYRSYISVIDVFSAAGG